MKLNIYISLFAASLLTACSDFLDVTPKGMFIPKTLTDYEELSSNPSFSSGANALVERMSDGIYLDDQYVKSGINSSSSKSYMWADEFYLETESDGGWDAMYNNIYNANVILSELGNIESNETERLNHIKGDALFNRSYAYWSLISTYAPHYSAETASQDLGVPLLTVPDLEATPDRASVASVYSLILQDLEEAADLLPQKAQNVYRKHKGAAWALLARVHLSMSNYGKAKEYALQALNTNDRLLDYNTLSFKDPERPHSGIDNKPLEYEHPEMIIYMSTGFGTILSNSCISPELMDIIDTEDLRYQLGWTQYERSGQLTDLPYPLYVSSDLNYNISVSEMMLIVAEAEARAGNTGKALQEINKLRKYRFSPNDYRELSASNAPEALKLVINERRIELFGKGLRWFDMKRLDQDPLFSRDYQRANEMDLFELKKGSPNFVVQIPAKIRLINPNILPNPR